MLIDVAALEKAFTQLQTSLQYFHSPLAIQDPNLRVQFRNSVMLCFSCAYEFAFKMIWRQLTAILSSNIELKTMNYADLIRTAAQAGLILNVQRFLQYRELRNLTSHTYDESKAELIIKEMESFRNDIESLLQQLKKRNPAK